MNLFWRLLGISVLVVVVAVGVTAVTIDRVADAVFADLMQEFHITTDILAGLFSAQLTRSLVITSLIAGGVGLLLSAVLFRAVTRPLRSVMTMAGRLASGDYAARADGGGVVELARLADSLNRMAEALQTLEALRKDLVANVAHELRTPLSNLRGYLEAVRDGLTTASPETLGMLHEEVMRLVRLVDALHELSRFDAQLARLRIGPVDLPRVVERQLALREAEFRAKGITVRSAVEPGLITGDGDLLAQAAANLVDNALKYTPAGGTVTVQVSRSDGQVKLAVTNTGGGIAADDLPYIFERFYRGEKSRSREWGGAGIGLAIVKEVARAHGGATGATSSGGATTIWFTLPG
ncbi:MAG TPA: ATP-binding protein [bacterium]|nr:ATP-binding protein [bacterium]